MCCRRIQYNNCDFRLNTPITINVSYDNYEPKELYYQFTGKARKFNVNIYPVGYTGEKIDDLVELLKNLGFDNPPVTTTSVTETTSITTATTTDVSENIIASGECGADGDNLTWTLDSEGTLVISGEGKMKDWTITGFSSSTSGGKIVSAEGKYSDDAPQWYNNRYSIKKILLNNGVTSIGEGAFCGCINVNSVEMLGSIATIGGYSFCLNSSLSDIIISDTVQNIGRYSFVKCSNLINIVIPNNVTVIGEYAFQDCSSLTNVKLSTNLYTLDHIFENCVSLTDIMIPEGISHINCAFDGTSIVELNLPSTVVNIGLGTFIHMPSLKSITVNSDNQIYCDENGILYNKDKTQLICFPCANEEVTYILPDSVTKIADNAFSYCSSLESIDMSESLSYIGSNSFYNCSNLKSIEIPTKVTTIYEGTFAYCSNLKTVLFSNNITNIKDSAFYFCSNLEILNLPENITKINSYAFGRCLNLKSVYIHNSVASIANNAFEYCTNLENVYYEGSEEEWNTIEINISNEYLTKATIHYNSSAPTSQTLSLTKNKTASASDSVKTYTYSNAVPNTEYLLMAVNNTETENILSSDNLLYIDQQTADDSGSATFNYTVSGNCKYIFIGDFGKGEFCRVISDTISTDTEKCTICNSSSDADNLNPDTVTTTTTTATTTVITTTTTAKNSNEVIAGDVNLDGIVSEEDAVLLEAYYIDISTGGFGTLSSAQLLAADINNDGYINYKDILLIREIASQNIKTTTVPITTVVSSTTTTTSTSAATTNKTTSSTTTITSISTLPTTTTLTTTTILNLGDVDDNRTVDALDASLVLTAYAMKAIGQTPNLDSEHLKAADVNMDGNVDALDASLILGYYAYRATGGEKNIMDYLDKI